MLSDQTFLSELRRDAAMYGRILYDPIAEKLQIVLHQQKYRSEALDCLERLLGPLGMENDIPDEEFQELRFPLLDRQFDQVMDVEAMSQLISAVSQFGSLNVDEHELVLRVRPDVDTVFAVHSLEKRLGVLMTEDEVHRVMVECHIDPTHLQRV